MGGRTALSGLWLKCGEGRGCDTSEFVIEAIRCSGESSPANRPPPPPG